MAINFDKALGIHQYTLGIRSKRAEVLASNVANADTPHYKAKDLDFSQALDQAKSQLKSGITMASTNEHHFALSVGSAPEVKYVVPDQPDTGDGNTVDIQKQQSSFMQNSLEYSMSFGMLNGKFTSLQKAIKGE